MFAHLARARGGAERGRRRLAAQLRGRGRRPPDRTSMMMAGITMFAHLARPPPGWRRSYGVEVDDRLIAPA